MRILISLYYYTPYISGLTIYAERLATALSQLGHTVTVLTSQYDSELPSEEWSAGVRIVRVPVAMRISKGVIMPTLGRLATKLIHEHDVFNIHLPNVDAPGLTIRGHLAKRPVILTYQCDLQLPRGPFNGVVNQAVFTAHYVAGRLADKIVTSTQDYASHSRLLSRFEDKLLVIPPPVVMPLPRNTDIALFKSEVQSEDRVVIGMAARLAAEKGVEHLVEAMPPLLERFPNAKVLFVGVYENVLGEQDYWQRLRGPISELGSSWKFLGPIEQSMMPAFYAACDVLTVPSLNSTEAFGLAQVEAMMCGTPVVASDLPGVRQPIKMTGMGEIVKPGSTTQLLDALTKVLLNHESYVRPRNEIEKYFDPKQTVHSYLALFGREIAKRAI